MGQPGHYFWIVSEHVLSRSERNRKNILPFNPEALPWINGKYVSEQTGQFCIYNFAGFTIIAYAGSPADNRPGSKSVFFVEADLSNEEMMKLILLTPMSKAIIDEINKRRK